MFKKENLIKNIIYIIIILILLWLIYLNFNKTKTFQKLEKTLVEKEKIDILINYNQKDRDGDGLKDWQEILYKTNLDLIDTDDDGISDFDEIEQNKDPLVFGDGIEDEIKKIKKTKNNVIGIKEQKEELNRYKKIIAEKERERFETYLENNNINISSKKKEKEDFKKKRNKKVKQDLNNMADSIIPYLNNLSRNNITYLSKMFTYFSEKKDMLNQKDVEEYQKILNNYYLIFKSLEKLDIKDSTLKKLNQEYSLSYKNLSDNIKYFLENSEKISKKDYLKWVEDYGKNIKKVSVSRKKIYFLINSYGIKFSNYDSGKMFDYKI